MPEGEMGHSALLNLCGCRPPAVDVSPAGKLIESPGRSIHPPGKLRYRTLDRKPRYDGDRARGPHNRTRRRGRALGV